MRLLPLILALLAATAAGVSSGVQVDRSPARPVLVAPPTPPPLADAPEAPAPTPAAAPTRVSPDGESVARRDRRPTRPRGSIEGIVVDEHGAPIEDFEVVPARAGIDPSGRGVSLGGGEFTYRCLTRHRGAGRFGHFLFSVHARRRVPYEMYPSEEQLAVLQRGGVVCGLRVVLPRAAVITGRVLRPDGAPAPHAVVRLASATDLLRNTWGHHAGADAEGRFEIDEVDPDADLRLRGRDGEELVSDTVPLHEILDGDGRADVTVVLRHRNAVVLEVLAAGLTEWADLFIDGTAYRPSSGPVTRIDMRTGPHLLSLFEGKSVLARVQFEIPEGLAVYRLDVTAQAVEETARADRPR